MVLQYFTVFIFALVIIEAAAYLPSHQEKCSLSDRRINECIVKQINRDIPKLVKGDPFLNIPVLSPLYLPEPVVLKNDRELRFKLRNVIAFGLEKTQALTVNFTGNYVKIVFINPRITLLGNYEIKGKLLNTHIFGTGSANITLVKGIYKYEADLPIKKIDGKAYFKVANPRATYETVRSFYQLNNLYEGDEYLSYEMNRYINENWVQVQKTLRPADNILISNIISVVLRGITNNVPINEIFRA